MIIKSLKISNITSYKEYDDFDECPKIQFNSGVNLIIGPNGSGKSNLLEIINRLFNAGLLRPIEFQEGPIKAKRAGKDATTINCLQLLDAKLTFPLNHSHQTGSQKIQIEIGFGPKDYENLKFIVSHKDEIQGIIEQYSTLRPTIIPISGDELEKHDSIILKFENKHNVNNLVLTSEHNADPEKLILTYLEYFNFLQYVIQIGNQYENKQWEFLSNPFLIFPSNRDYTNIDSNFQISPNEQDVLQSLKSTMAAQSIVGTSKDEPPVFTYIRARLCYKFHSLVMEYGMGKITDSKNFDDPLFIDLNEKLNRTLGIEIYIKKLDPNTQDYSFMIRESTSQNAVLLGERSAGEKGLIHFIFSIFGYGLENGVMIIDEPELHLHPQMQEKCLDLLKVMANDFSMQFIIVTHSPILVNYEIIEGVQRFYKSKNETQIVSPEFNIEEQDLVRYLNFTRATKVLFGNHVVLVEGDSDEYFYNYFYDRLKKDKIDFQDLEFLNIGGVDYRKPWKKFFNSWQIKHFLIRDKDALQLSNDEIEERYDQGEFILKEGKLEDYLSQNFEKKLKNVISFCKNDFDVWFKDEGNMSKIQELEKIFSKINESIKEN